MDTFAQTSSCSCSGKHSAVPLLTKYKNPYGSTRKQSVRSLALQPQAVDFKSADSGSLSLASLRIQALRPPERLSPGREDRDEPQLHGYSHGDCSVSSRNGSDCTLGFGEITSRESEGPPERDSKPHGGASKPPGQGTEPRRRHTAPQRRMPLYVSFGHSSQSHTLPQPHDHVDDSLHDARERQSESRKSHGLESIGTYGGEFLSGGPPPLFKSKSDLRQQERTSREQCCSGVAPDGGQRAGKNQVTSLARAQRGKSAGDNRYCGRPCDACSLRKLRQWAQEQETKSAATTENSTKMYVTNNAATHCQGRKLLAGSGGGGQLVEMVRVTQVSMPGRGLPKLTGLQHELADPTYYERRQQENGATNHHLFHHHQYVSRTLQDSGSRRPKSVVRNRAMLRHVQLGNELLRLSTHDDDDDTDDDEIIRTRDFQDLLKTILIYEIPGVSKMKDNYRGLVDTTAAPEDEGEEADPDINSWGHIAHQALLARGHAVNPLPATAFPSQTSSSQFFPSLLPGQRP